MRYKLFTLGLAAAAFATALLAAGPSVSKVSTYGFAGRSGDATLLVDMDAARYRGGEKYIPLLIYLGHTERKTLHAHRTTFTLTDPSGVKHPLPAPEVVTEGYGPNLLSNDYTYLGRLPDYGSMLFLANVQIPKVAFFANPSGPPRILYDKVELPNRTFFIALLYFPNPQGKASGTYTLTYDDPESGTRIEVPFTIPWAH
ncbi:MAG: hypothetical protein AB1347_03550 [Acidobacteriota bacterium]